MPTYPKESMGRAKARAQGKSTLDASGVPTGRHLSSDPKSNPWVPVDSVQLKGFERVEHVPKSSFRDCSMSVIVPSRTPYLHSKFVQAINSLVYPMNGKRAMFYVTGAEVGKAYDEQVAAILAHPDLGKWQYILTLEDDTLPPPDAPIRLCEAIEMGPYDGVGGLYFTKGEFAMPMIYGDAEAYARTGALDFRPHDPVPYLSGGSGVVECNGIAMGCTLYRVSSLKNIPAPRFQTLNDITPQGPQAYTQDLFYCQKAKRAGQRFAVDCRVRCGHADWSTGIVY